MARGRQVDVSGGKVVYTGGTVRTSQLVTADGRVVDISQADPNVVYTGIRNPQSQQVYSKWGVVENFATTGLGVYEPGYVDGQQRGHGELRCSGARDRWHLVGHATAGIHQRSPASAPLGGQLVVGIADGQGLPFPDFLAPSIHFTDTPLAGDGSVLQLGTAYLRSGGFTRTALYSNGVISLDAGTNLALAPGSTLALTGSVVSLDGQIRAPSGQVTATSANVDASVRQSGGDRPGVFLGNGASIDTSGRWINDSRRRPPPGATDLLFVNGGTIELGVPTPEGELEPWRQRRR